MRRRIEDELTVKKKNVRDGRGIMESDQSLWQDSTTRNFAERFMGMRFGWINLKRGVRKFYA